MCAKQVLNVGTGKLHVKDHMENRGGLGGKSMRIFVVVAGFVFF